MPLIVLSPERIAEELRRVAANEAAERAWRRRVTITFAHASLWWAFGLFLTLASFHAVGQRAQALMAVGWFVGSLAPVVVLFFGWLREQQ